MIRLHGAFVWVYETIFNTKYFIFNNKITALCCRHCWAMLTYIYIRTQVASCVLDSENDRDTTFKRPYPRLISRAQTHLHLGECLLIDFQERFHYMHTQVAVYLRFGWWWQAHIHTPIVTPTLDCVHKHTFLFHAYRSVSLTHAALHSTCILISSGWGKFS